MTICKRFRGGPGSGAFDRVHGNHAIAHRVALARGL
jgi:hypothetical protein